MEYFLGIDAGSGSVRAGVFDEKGNMLSTSSEPIEISRPEDNFAEQSSENIWSNCCKAVRNAVSLSKIPVKDIKGIGFDAACSLVALNKDSAPLSVSQGLDPHWNVIMWMDHRAITEAQEIDSTKSRVLRFTGGKMSPEMEIPKILWLKRHLPGQYEKSGKLFDLADYLVFQATGKDIRSTCTLACKWTWISHEKKWDKNLFEKIGLTDLFSGARIGNEIKEIGEKASELSESSASAMGLPPGIAVSTGMIDAHAGGIGIIGDDPFTTLALIGGTSSCHMALSQKPLFVKGIWGPYFGAMMPGTWLSEGGQSATGALIDHIIINSEIYPALNKEAEDSKKSIYELLNSEVAFLKTKDLFYGKDLQMLGYFHGNRSPRADAELKGMISGLTLNRTRTELASLYLAAIRSVAYGTRHIIETLNKKGHHIKKIHICGGGTKNPLFLQEHADITGCEIILPKAPEAVLLGSAMLGASASGKYKNIQEAMKQMSGISSVIKPNPAMTRFHARKYKIFLEMFNDQIKYRKMAEFGNEP